MEREIKDSYQKVCLDEQGLVKGEIACIRVDQSEMELDFKNYINTKPIFPRRREKGDMVGMWGSDPMDPPVQELWL